MNRRAAALIGLLALAITAALLGTTGTLATWTDSATVQSGRFSAAAMEPVADAGCTDPPGFSAVIRWRNVDVRYRYLVQVRNASGQVLGTAEVANNGVVGGMQSLEIFPGDYGTHSGVTWSRRNYTASIRGEAGAWGTESRSVDFFVSGLILELGARAYVQCG